MVPVDKSYKDTEWVTKLPRNANGDYYVDQVRGQQFAREPIWHYGHVKDFSNRKLVADAQARGLTQKEFSAEVNSHPEYFQIQDAHSNWRHLNE